MRTRNWIFPLGMIGVLSFLMLTILGRILCPGYNPVTMYVSVLLTDEVPYSSLMRIFMNIYTVCFFLFTLVMAVYSVHNYRLSTKLGYILLCAAGFIALTGYGPCPISMALIFSRNDIIHVIVTVTVLCLTAIAVLLIAIGYIKQKKHKVLGRISLTILILFTAANLWHLYVILTGQNINGLVERIIFYIFHTLTFIMSWVYTFKRRSMEVRRLAV